MFAALRQEWEVVRLLSGFLNTGLFATRNVVNAAGRGERYALIKSKAERRPARIDKEKTVHATSKSSTTNN